ncbi:transposase [Caballeronia sordidicola]|uniref:Mobile element protein n=1 Tax=Caballeronia sordidicola TaxID=196367 RepID=A0A242MKU2_CABSO|nr:transposase [Caballeronia sordidicola]OTP71927.1 Mobile element protein [Caballeronia sordidicola]
MKYSEERKEAILKRLLAPHNCTVSELSREEGISEATIYNWRKAARGRGRLLPGNAADSESWSSRDKFNAVLESAALSEIELAEYCRRRGLYPEQLQRWRASCELANERSEQRSRQDNETLKVERRRNKDLERELRRKNAALAETAALLTLRKKARAIWGGEDE